MGHGLFRIVRTTESIVASCLLQTTDCNLSFKIRNLEHQQLLSDAPHETANRSQVFLFIRTKDRVVVPTRESNKLFLA